MWGMGEGRGWGWEWDGWMGAISRGDEVGSVVACCTDQSGEYLKPTFVAMGWQHSRRWSLDGPTREIWAVSEVTACSAWKVEGGEITVILL